MLPLACDCADEFTSLDRVEAMRPNYVRADVSVSLLAGLSYTLEDKSLNIVGILHEVRDAASARAAIALLEQELIRSLCHGNVCGQSSYLPPAIFRCSSTMPLPISVLMAMVEVDRLRAADYYGVDALRCLLACFERAPAPGEFSARKGDYIAWLSGVWDEMAAGWLSDNPQEEPDFTYVELYDVVQLDATYYMSIERISRGKLYLCRVWTPDSYGVASIPFAPYWCLDECPQSYEVVEDNRVILRNAKGEKLEARKVGERCFAKREHFEIVP